MPSVSRLYTAVGVTTPLVGFSLSAVTCNASISISRSSLTVSGCADALLALSVMMDIDRESTPIFTTLPSEANAPYPLRDQRVKHLTPLLERFFMIEKFLKVIGRNIRRAKGKSIPNFPQKP